ncbi:NfeD family protein [Thermocoleostomius sinensis]|jgi:membrane protein implicated in regulation of membrane protease activity|uniref:NfeD family protein n=1 Tax=Thermocoleostomius sinensis A174 TaxID=2016057 RepID=A0A9E9CAG5_9CYAN|nr:NfeD family protein [Thermocoleostomius sinensis]WAL60947.1 NfeD family protein [Thermocoleostomius sinensis A174]
MSLGTPLFWIIAGVSLCMLELVLPTAFIELTMGLSAIIVAIFALSVPIFSVQVALWLVLSIVLTILLRRLVPPRKHRQIEDSKEAQTLTEILPGQTGRVLYEGNSWQARCEDDDLTIAANQRVYVLERRGTTLIVLPANLLHH